jgi:hypothetical protein
VSDFLVRRDVDRRKVLKEARISSKPFAISKGIAAKEEKSEKRPIAKKRRGNAKLTKL